MYDCQYQFLESKNLMNDLQFGFWQKHTTSHALIHFTDKIREKLDKGNFGCGIFANFQKAFDTVDCDILIQNLNYYGVRDTAKCRFSSVLKNRTQFVSINGYQFHLHFIRCDVQQGSILGPLLFLIYIHDLHYAIKNCKVHHFAGDTNLLNFSHSIEKMNKQVNHDLKNFNLTQTKLFLMLVKLTLLFLNH